MLHEILHITELFKLFIIVNYSKLVKHTISSRDNRSKFDGINSFFSGK